MLKMKNLFIVSMFAAVGFLSLTQSAHASAVIATGDIRLGVNDQGHLNVFAPGIAKNGSYVGLTYLPVGDATAPGCLCEGWGVAATESGSLIRSGNAGIDVGGINNITVDSFTSTASTATSIVHLTNLSGLTVKQEYMPSASSALFQNKVTITNSTGSLLTDVRYTRGMDWDVPPTEFSEFVTIGGLPATAVLFTSDNGFATPNPYSSRGDLAGCGSTTNFTDCGPYDHGAIFDFGFGSLADGESTTFNIYYGAAANEADAYAALGTVGASVYSLGQSSTPNGAKLGTPATFMFAFGGDKIGGTPLPDPGTSTVPEPVSLFLLGSGAAGLLGLRRKKA